MDIIEPYLPRNNLFFSFNTDVICIKYMYIFCFFIIFFLKVNKVLYATTFLKKCINFKKIIITDLHSAVNCRPKLP